jgi:quercetin dioxygenase-like cupin family protein
MVRGWPGRGSVKEEGKRKSMNGPHKFGTEFGSDNAPEHSAAIVSHHDSIKWFEAIPGEQLCIRVHGTQVNGRYAIMENIAAPGTATPMHFHAEDEIFHILEGTVTFSIDGDVFNASVGSIVVIPAGAHHAWRNRSNAPIRMSTFFSPGGVEELYPKLVGLSLEELSTVVEPFGSGIVGPPIDE